MKSTGNRSPSLQKVTRNSLFATLEHNEITSLPTERGFCQTKREKIGRAYSTHRADILILGKVQEM